MSDKAAPHRSRARGEAAGYHYLVTTLAMVSVRLAALVAMRIWRMTRRYPVPDRETRWLGESRSTFIRVGKRRVCLRQWGAGDNPPVVLVHGWGGRGSQMAALAQPLVDAGYAVIAPDLPGHGDSEGNDTDFFECSQVLKVIQQTHGHFAAIIAHSFGGVSSTCALRMGVTADTCVLIGVPFSGEKIFAAYTHWLSPPPRVVERLHVNLRRQFGDDVLQVMSPGEHAQHLRLPCLLMHDEQDRDVLVESARLLAKQWNGATLLCTQGLGHRRILRDASCVQQVVAFVSG